MTDKTFDTEYVKKLREEAASWRTKYRELEAQQATNAVSLELAKRGIQADPTWVKLEEGQEIGDAIDSLVEQYPHLQPTTQSVVEEQNDSWLQPEPKPRVTPKPVAPTSPRSTTPKPARTARITKRNIAEIKKDPKARAKVRDLYRELLQQGSNQSGD